VNRLMRTLVTTLLVSGCVSWQPTEIAAPETVPSNRVIRVWSGSNSVRWRSVQVTHDSLSGLPTSAASSCTTCRVALPLTAVDSTDSQTANALPVVLAAAPFVFLMVSILSYDSSPTSE
jgi:hypothetical protein